MFSLSGVHTAHAVPRPADSDPGRQGALSRGGKGLHRQDEQFVPAKGEVGGKDHGAVQEDGEFAA